MAFARTLPGLQLIPGNEHTLSEPRFMRISAQVGMEPFEQIRHVATEFSERRRIVETQYTVGI